jgi:hypothetical protein
MLSDCYHHDKCVLVIHVDYNIFTSSEMAEKSIDS